jgi:hypothetical protein
LLTKLGVCRITAGPSTTAFHKKRLKDLEKKKIEEQNAEAKANILKEIEAKIIQQKKEKDEREREANVSPKNSNQLAGVVLMSKKKNRDWLNVPRRQKPKYPMFEEQVKEDEVIEIEEDEDIPDDPVLLTGGKANLLDVKVAELIRMDPERDCRKYNVKSRAKEIFKALDVDKDGLVDEDEFIEGKCENWQFL